MSELSRPTGRDPESHYRHVAQVFVEATEAGRSPAETIARAAGIPLATARGWIREARRYGFLTPGRDRPSVLERVAMEIGVEPEALRAAIKRHSRGRGEVKA